MGTEDEAKEELTRRLAKAESDLSIADAAAANAQAAAANAQVSQTRVNAINVVLRAYRRLSDAKGNVVRVDQIQQDLDIDAEETRKELEESRQDLHDACILAEVPNNKRGREEDESETGMILLFLVP